MVLPERIRLDEWGYPIIDSRPIQDGLIGDARHAVDLCPVLALSLRQGDAPTARRS
jgi:ferredoxin